MGAGIATVSAQAGWEVLLNEVNPSTLDAAFARIQKGFDRQVKEGRTSSQEADRALKHIRTTQSLGDMVDVQLVIEAVPEHIDLKSRLFWELGRICKPEVILASNRPPASLSPN